MSDKPSAAWYLAPIFLGIIGSGIMWYVLKDVDHPDAPKMIRKGWVIGIILTLIDLAWWIPFMLIPFAFMGVDHQQIEQQMEQQMKQQIGQQALQQMGQKTQQPVPAPGKEQCEIAGGLWGIWSNRSPATASCNPSTSDGGKECSDSSQCQSFCQAKEGAQIGIEDAGMCYEYEFAICMQEVRNGVVDAEWCQ